MNAAPPPLPSCPVCQTSLGPNGTCPRCRASEDWKDQIEGIDFVLRRFKDWNKCGQLSDNQLQMLTDRYEKRRQAMEAAAGTGQPFQRAPAFSPRDECWSCQEYLATNSSHCHSCGAPITDPGVRSRRYWCFLNRELEQLEESGSLKLRQIHEFLGDTRERIEALTKKLERERAPMVLPVEEQQDEPRRRRRRRDEEAPVEEGPRRTVLEIILDPQSIQWLLGCGGALTVLGLVIWLASIGLFGNPVYIAIALGLGNAVLLGGGWALLERTRYQVAGRALTLLACLVMPLNLWFRQC